MSRDIHPIILCSVMSVGELVQLKLTISLILYPFFMIIRFLSTLYRQQLDKNTI